MIIAVFVSAAKWLRCSILERLNDPSCAFAMTGSSRNCSSMARVFRTLGLLIGVGALLMAGPPARKKMKIDASLVDNAGSMGGLLNMLGCLKAKGFLRDDVGEVPAMRDVQKVVCEYGDKDTPYGKLATRPGKHPTIHVYFIVYPIFLL